MTDILETPVTYDGEALAQELQLAVDTLTLDQLQELMYNEWPKEKAAALLAYHEAHPHPSPSVIYTGILGAMELNIIISKTPTREQIAIVRAWPREKMSAIGNFFGIRRPTPSDSLEKLRESEQLKELLSSRFDQKAQVTAFYDHRRGAPSSNRQLEDLVFCIKRPEFSTRWMTYAGLVYWAQTGIYAYEHIVEAPDY